MAIRATRVRCVPGISCNILFDILATVFRMDPACWPADRLLTPSGPFFSSLDLEAKLKDAEDAKIKMIVTDGVFSMDGNVAPLPEICELAEKYGALTFIGTVACKKTCDLVNLPCKPGISN